MKFEAADFNGSETAYAFDVVRGAPGATDDTVGNRQQFLDDVQTFQAAARRVPTAISWTPPTLALEQSSSTASNSSWPTTTRSSPSSGPVLPPTSTAAGDLLVGPQIDGLRRR